jgi:putative heme-binding domain-containing protein
VLLTLKNGQEHAGVVKKETEEQLVIASVEEGMLTLAKSSITERRPSLSAMPESLSQQLSKRELRDLVEFLSGL